MQFRVGDVYTSECSRCGQVFEYEIDCDQHCSLEQMSYVLFGHCKCCLPCLGETPGPEGVCLDGAETSIERVLAEFFVPDGCCITTPIARFHLRHNGSLVSEQFYANGDVLHWNDLNVG